MIDPRQLRPSQLVQLLNSTPLGEVANERMLRRHRVRAGLRIGDGKTVDLLRYVAWLVIERHRPKPEPEGLTGYEAHKERQRARQAELSLSGRDIGELPAVVNAERRAKAECDFRYFCEQYFQPTFNLPWSPDHLKVIAKIERAVIEGGLFAMAMPRGSGKTSLCETACLWALLYGHREFVALIGSDEEHAASMLDSIKVELESSDLLLGTSPRSCSRFAAWKASTSGPAGSFTRANRPTSAGRPARSCCRRCRTARRVAGSSVSLASPGASAG